MKSSKNPVKEFEKALKNEQICFLHSGEKGISILAKKPAAKYSGSNIEQFKKFAEKHKKKLLIGYISYDIAYQLFDIKAKAKNDLKLPNIYFLAFDKWTEFKNTEKPTIEISRSKHKSKNFQVKISESDYKKAYDKIKNYLIEGDIYQINLTHRLEAETNLNPRELFLRIIRENPVNHLAYIEDQDFQILSASPERFVKINKDKIETCPIKGTRPRGKTAKEDKKLSNELLKSEKEEAELNMITDLLRNDLGAVCKIGSVKVRGHRQLQKCPSVWHTYSKITGVLSAKPLEAIISMLPGGSISGCPKKRAIEIIDELEPVQRGVYTGIIGYIHPKDILDFNIAIRTIVKKGKKLYLQVGGGIVIDSNKENEYQETLDKAKSFMKILI